MKREPLIYEGRVRLRDVEPGVGGDVFELTDHPDRNGDSKMDWPTTLDAEFEKWWGEFISCGPPVGPLRITIEEIE